MNDSQIYDQLLKNAKVLGSLDASVANLTKEVELLHRYERRLTRVETEVKVAKRIFGSLFGLLVASVAAVANWLK